MFKLTNICPAARKRDRMKKATVLLILAAFAAGILIGGCSVYLLTKQAAPKQTELVSAHGQPQGTQNALQQPGFAVESPALTTVPGAELSTTTAAAQATTRTTITTSTQTTISIETTAVMQNISMEQAAAVALQAAGLAENNVVFKRVVRSGDTPKYEVIFFYGGMLYTYDVRRSDGVITSGNKTPAEDSDIKRFSGGIILPMAKAKEVALKDAKLDDAEFTRIRLEKDDGTLYYKLEFCTARMEYKYEIHAATGVVLDRDSDERD